MNEDITKFLELDNINTSKFLANSEIIKYETKEIYQATVKLYPQEDLSADVTETIHWIALAYNQPLGYPQWFMAGYPDVVKWFSDLDEEKIISIVGDLTQDDMDGNSHFKLPILRKLVDAYKSNNELECC